MELLYVRASDGWIELFIDQHHIELYPEDNYDWLLREVKTTSLLMDWISEMAEEQISGRYHVGPGDVRRVAGTAEWLMHSVARLSQQLDLGATYNASLLEKRIHYGAGPDLMALLDLKGVGRVRARKLHEAGYTSLEKIQKADRSSLGEVIGPKTAEKLMAQLREMMPVSQDD